ncbi:MAG: hypothetical protein KGN31_07480 [Betaproteobacteria bacterium]|nr:hypothetical protein [Betaproteobacteria bacterium]MDE2424032.1 hypothetical protein [Betaproteobacteria bacterium]
MKNKKLISALATASLLAAVNSAYAGCAPSTDKKCSAKVSKCAGKNMKDHPAMKKCAAKTSSKCGAKSAPQCGAKKM